jgi:hypothetical protein
MENKMLGAPLTGKPTYKKRVMGKSFGELEIDIEF